MNSFWGYILTGVAVVFFLHLMESLSSEKKRQHADNAMIAACVADGRRVEDCRALLRGGYLEELVGEE